MTASPCLTHNGRGSLSSLGDTGDTPINKRAARDSAARRYTPTQDGALDRKAWDVRFE